MKMKTVGISIMLIVALLWSSTVLSQVSYDTAFTTAITFQNISATPAAVNFEFYRTVNSQPLGLYRSLNGFAGNSLFVGSPDVGVGSSFLGSTVMWADQTVVATAIQLPLVGSPVKNRPLSNAFTAGFTPVGTRVLLASLLKNQFNTTSKFAIQNITTSDINITINIYDAANPTATPTTITSNNVPPGSSAHFDMGVTSSVPIAATSFNGSATVDATGNIVGTVLELSTNGYAAKAFEGISAGSNTVYMPTALCNVFGGTTTAYAVQNVSTSSASVTVTYYPGNATETVSIAAGTKKSLNGCLKVDGVTPINASNYNGAAKLVSTGGAIVAIGKAFKSADATYSTAFIGEASGSRKLALPYIRWSQNNYTTGKNQRASIAIQNASSSAVSNVQVRYYNAAGVLIGTHTISSIAANEKAGSSPINATLASGRAQIELDEFGNPESGQVGYGGQR